MVSAEISLYPIKNEHRPIIEQFLAKLHDYPIEIITSTMITRLFGEDELVWKAISDSFAHVSPEGLITLNLKILNTDLRPASNPFGDDSPYHQ